MTAGGQYMSSSSCRICGDRGAGAHYGVVTCVACKSFFKRTVQLCLTYRCDLGGRCRIKQATRKQCQSCRFQCCLRAGMRTDLVRSLADDVPEASRVNFVSAAPAAMRQVSSSSGTFLTVSSPESAGSSASVPSFYGELSEVGVVDPLLQCLVDIEPAEFNIDSSFAAQHFLPESVRNTTRLLTAADTHATAVARWVSRLPGLEALTPAERERLFEENWPAPVVASVAWRSRSEPPGSLRVCANLQLTNAVDVAPRVLRGALTEALRLAQQLRYLQLSRDEYLALKPLLFLSAQDAELLSRAEPLMDPYLKMLGRVCPSRDRRARLLLLTGGVSCVRFQAAAFWRRAAAREGHALPPLLATALRGLVRLRYYWP